MKNLLVVLIILICALSSYAQKDTLKNKINFVGVNIGFGYIRYSDPLESANVYLGNYLPIRVAWTAISNKHTDRFSFTYSGSELSQAENNNYDKTNFKTSNFQINYHYQRAIFNKGNVILFLGGGINGYISWRTLKYDYFQGNVIDSNNGDFFISANISLASCIKQKNNLLLVNISNSAFAYMNSNLFRTGQKEWQFKAFPKFNFFYFNADYKIKLNKILYFDLGYSFYYYRYPRYDQISITKGAHNQLFAGINFRF